MSEQDFEIQDGADERHGTRHQSTDEYAGDQDSSDWEYTSSGSDDGVIQIWWPEHIGLDVETLRKNAFSNNSSTSFSETQSGRLNPNLCTFCRVFFDTWDKVTTILEPDECVRFLNTPHFETLEGLTASARRGCQLCKYFASLIDLDKDFDVPSSSKLPKHMSLDYITRYHGVNPDVQDLWRLSLLVGSAELGDRWEGIEYGVILLPVDFEKESDIKLAEISLRPEQTDVIRQENSLLIARGWLEECSKSHDCYRAEHQDMGPTRLIKISNNKIRLCIAKEEDDSASYYSTLSHCWGSDFIIRLLQHNLEKFMNDIPEDALSKTFHDSIEVARTLGFDYIWIDSLCIVQDDPADWERESSLMAGVYGSSGLNIAATASPDGAKGCLFYRDIIYRQGGKLDVDIDGIRRSYTFCDEKLYSRNLQSREGAPLLDRAWVLQERLLAPRTLHFAASQLFWECGAKFACETFPCHIPRALYLNDFQLPTNQLWKHWDKIIIRYCGSTLTNSSDKLVALAGIARRIAENNGDSYFAGLWRLNFERELCWYVEDGFSNHTRPSKPSAGTVFPSWSWASIDGDVHTFRGSKLPLQSNPDFRHLEIVNIDVVLQGSDPFGNIIKANLTLKSSFLVCASKIPDSPMEIRGHSIPEGEVLWDSSDYEVDQFMLLSMGIRRGEWSNFILEALILCPTHQHKGEYRRIGRYRLSEVHTSVLLENVRSRILDDPFELRDSSHLPMEEDCISIGMDESGVKWYEIDIV